MPAFRALITSNQVAGINIPVSLVFVYKYSDMKIYYKDINIYYLSDINM